MKWRKHGGDYCATWEFGPWSINDWGDKVLLFIGRKKMQGIEFPSLQAAKDFVRRTILASI